MGIADYYVAVPSSFASEWADKVDKPAQHQGSEKVFNQLYIERHTYGKNLNQAYIPASSVKGALVMAYLDYCYQQKGNKPFYAKDDSQTKKDYVGNFHESRYNHLAFGDFMANGAYKGTKLYYMQNKKRKNGEGSFKGTIRCECLLPVQHRAFGAELSIYDDKKCQNLSQNSSLAKELKILHDYSTKLLREELQEMQVVKGVNQAWAKSLVNLIQSMPNAYLVRLGKCGADNKIYRGKDIAKIAIKKAGDQERPTTWWFADSTKGLQPLGWALIELDPQGENTALKTWCQENAELGVDFAQLKAIQEAKQREIQQRQAEHAEE